MLKGLLTGALPESEDEPEKADPPMPASRFAPSLVVLLLGCTAMTCGLAGPAQAWSLFGGKKDAAKTAEKTATEKSAMTMNENVEDGVRQAQALRLAGNYPEAIRHLSQLMMVASDDPGVVSEYGKTLAAQGRAEDAVNFLTRAQQLRPGDWTLYSAMGVAQDQLGQHDQARIAYEAGLRLRPEEASILSNYALSRLLAKDPDGARALNARAERAGGGSDAKIARNIALVREMAPASQASATPQATDVAQAVPPAHHAPAPVQHAAAAQAQQAPARIAPVAAPVAAQAPIPAATKTAPPITAAPITVAARPVQSVPFVNLPSPAAAPQPAPHSASSAGPVIQARPPAPSRVVMQQVPVDPLAGPVKNRVATHAPRALTPPQAAPVMAKAEAHPQERAQEKPQEKSQPKPAPQMAAANTPQTEAQALQARAEALAKAMTAQPAKAAPAPTPAPVKAAEAKPAPLEKAIVKAAPAKLAEAPKPAPAPAKPAAPVKTAEAAKPKDAIPSLRMSANAY